MRESVFLDTVGLIAVWDNDDQWHAPALAAYERQSERRARFFTTACILYECGNAAAKKPYRLEVDDLRKRLESVGRLIQPTTEDWREAWASYSRRTNADAGIVDQISFIVMRRLGITRAFTNDRHFRAAGFESLF